MSYTILIVEDDNVMRETISDVLAKRGYKTFLSQNGKDAVELIQKEKIDLVLLDLRLPDIDGITVLKKIRKIDEGIQVIVMTAFPDVKSAILAIKSGAYDYINKPFELEELMFNIEKALEIHSLKTEVQRLKYQQKAIDDEKKMIGISPKFIQLKNMLSKVAKAPKTPVLIYGETGTGKELIANELHRLSDRKDKPLVKLNCSAIPEQLLESELFGYEKGAFTDAKQRKKGLLELADGGTIFLDEIGDMSINLQPKLLRVLETQSFRRIGGLTDIYVDIRIIAATHLNLKSMIKDGRFRDDLYYRLKVVTLDIPPLRERVEDIISLSESFIEENNRSFGKEIKGFTDEAEKMLLSYHWPGNIRELKNIIERASILAVDWITPENLPLELTSGGEIETDKTSLPVRQTGNFKSQISNSKSHNEELLSLSEIEKRHIQSVLSDSRYNITKASNILGISRLTLREKIKKYKLSMPA